MILNSRPGLQFRTFVFRIAITALMSGVLIGCYATRAEAQWTTNGNNINNTNTGNVGIGTTSPQNPLTIARSGSAPWTGRPAYELLQLIDRTDNTPQIMFGSANNGMFLRYTGPVAGASQRIGILNGASVESFVVNNDGNVGIGTTNPKTKLHVDMTGITDFTGSTPGGFTLGGSGANNFVPIDFRSTDSANHPYPMARIAMQFTNSGSNLLFGTSNSYGTGVTNTAMVINYLGNVGIGTTNPLFSLDVNGGINGFRAKASTASSLDAIAVFENANGIQAIVRGNGNIGIGTTNPGEKLDVNGNISVTGTGNITATGTIEAGNIKAKYQDVAEWVPTTHALPAGTVVTLDPTKSNHVEASSKAYDTRVAGVISAQPGIALGESGDNKVLVATTGRVKIKVDASHGPINVGDLLVTSSVPGVAMKSQPVNVAGVEMHRPGTLIGKALEPLTKGQAEILVLLSLQ